MTGLNRRDSRIPNVDRSNEIWFAQCKVVDLDPLTFEFLRLRRGRQSG